MKLKTLIDCLIIIAVAFQIGHPHESTDCYGESYGNYDYRLFHEKIEGRCCGYELVDNNIAKECP